MTDQSNRKEVIEPDNMILTGDDAILMNRATRRTASGQNSRRGSSVDGTQVPENHKANANGTGEEYSEKTGLFKGASTGCHGENFAFDSIDERVEGNCKSSNKDTAGDGVNSDERISGGETSDDVHGSENIIGRSESDVGKSDFSKVTSKIKSHDKDLPALNVTTDPNLKSCLSLNSEARSNDTDRSEGEKEMHPLFYIKPDTISPNMHGLISRSSKSASVGADKEASFVHSLASPIISSNSNSAISSAPNSPPLVFQSRAKSPPLSRVNSLRYTLEGDKRIIDVMRQSNNSPTDSGFDNGKESDSKLHLLIGITGCISIHKNIFLIIEKLYELYTHEKLEIQVVLTEAAEYFLVDKLHKFESLGVKVWFHNDIVKYYMHNKSERNNSAKLTHNTLCKYLLNYELVKWTDVLLIAPLSANTLAKMINGLCDDLLNDILRIWPIHQTFSTDAQKSQRNAILTNDSDSPKPIIAALALTSSMYAHPITKRQLAILQDTYPNISILKPVEKFVDVDGNISMGGMRSWREVVDFVSKKLGPPSFDEDEDEDKSNDGDEEIQAEFYDEDSDNEDSCDDDDDDDDDVNDAENEADPKLSNKSESNDRQKNTVN